MTTAAVVVVVVVLATIQRKYVTTKYNPKRRQSYVRVKTWYKVFYDE